MKFMRVFGASLTALVLSVAVWGPIREAGAEVALAIEPPAAAAEFGRWMDAGNPPMCREDSSTAALMESKSEGLICRTDPCFHPVMCASPCTACISGRCR